MKNLPLAFEQLEPRFAPGGFADPHVTISFAPEGTQWSNNGTTAEVSAMWRGCILEAAAEYGRVSGLSFELVPDDGTARLPRAPDGRAYQAQGEESFGDIRIGAAGDGWNDGSTLDLGWYQFMPSNAAGGGDQWIDLDHPRTLAILADHEAMHRFSLFVVGNMLGLPAFHRAPAGSLMRTPFSGPHELTAGDITGIQAMYGEPEESAVVSEQLTAAALRDEDGRDERRDGRREERRDDHHDHRAAVRYAAFTIMG